MATLVQSKTAVTTTGISIAATFDATPTEGNTLVVWVAARADPSLITRTISGTGWTERFYRSVTTDTTYRRQLWAYTKVAGAAEPAEITADMDVSSTMTLVIEEWSGLGAYIEATSNDNGLTANATSVATGTVASAPAGAIGLAAFAIKKNSNHPSNTVTPSWSNSFSSATQSFPIDVNISQLATSQGSIVSSGDITTTASFTADNSTVNNGLTAGILVFNPEGAATGPTITSTSKLTSGKSFTITGTDFAATGNVVLLSPTDDSTNVNAATQTVSTESTTEIVINSASLPTGTSHADTVYLFVDNGEGYNAEGYVVTVNHAPVISTGTVVDATASTLKVRFTTDTANGTAYWALYPNASPDPTTPAQIQGGTDGDNAATSVATGNLTVTTTGTQTSAEISGLDPDTTYKSAVVHYGDASQ